MDPVRIFIGLKLAPETLQTLQEATRGHTLVFSTQTEASIFSQAPVDPQFHTVDIAFGQPSLEAIAAAPRLRWVQVSTSGITRYDTDAFRATAAQRGLVVTNSAGVYNRACAAHVFSFILAQARALPQALSTHMPSSAPQWRELRQQLVTLDGQTIVLVGFGAIARRLVELLAPFPMKVLGYRRRARGDEGIPMLTTPEELDQALAACDHVVNILPEAIETRGFFDAPRLARIKGGAAFYNIGRGITVDQMALNNALRGGHLAAAWLDVTDPEPLPERHPLLSAPHCYITPHIAGGHAHEGHTLVRHFVDNFQRWVAGTPLHDRVM